MTRPPTTPFLMPAEWEKQERTLIAWPARAATWNGGIEAAKTAHAGLARTILEAQPVTVICNQADVVEASLACGSGVEILPLALSDGWVRDTGPTFVRDAAGSRVGVDWRFNGWGGLHQDWQLDARLAEAILQAMAAPRLESPLVLEGGAIHVDGAGTALVTEECLLDPRRNPGWSKQAIEAELNRTLGVSHVIWLGRGHIEDETTGHIDEVACFVAPGRILIQTTHDTGDSNYPIVQDNLDRLAASRDAAGRTPEIVQVAQPARRDLEGKRMTLGYVNFVLANGLVVMPSFDDPADADALSLAQSLWPERRVVQFRTLDIIRGGGGLHCITQQVPAAW